MMSPFWGCLVFGLNTFSNVVLGRTVREVCGLVIRSYIEAGHT